MDVFSKNTDCQQVHEKRLNITKERMINANQNHNEVSLYTCRYITGIKRQQIIQ